MWFAADCKKHKYMVSKKYNLQYGPSFHVWGPSGDYCGKFETALDAFIWCEQDYKSNQSVGNTSKEEMK